MMTSRLPAIGSAAGCRARRASLCCAFGVAVALSGPADASADVVLEWNAISVTATAGNPFTQARFLAITQLAVFEAVNAITREYEPYLGTISAPPGASADAAAIAAAYRVLKNYFPANATLDTQRASSLAAIPDGQAKDDGIAVGEAAAAAMIELREPGADGIGDNCPVPAPPGGIEAPGPANPGVWQKTPSCPAGGGVFAAWKNVAPFGVQSAADFLLEPPPAITSSQYAKDYDEVKRVGSKFSAERPADRSDVADFYAASSPGMLFNSAARQLSVARGDSLSRNARNLALVNMAMNDALVASFLNKYHYDYWRPETAIRLGDTDGNDKTDPDAAFEPYIATPCFPSYPSNHAAGSYAGAEILRRIYGAGGHSLTLENPAVPAIVFHYSELKQITDNVDDARVYGGIHYRFDQDAGGKLGRGVATYVYKNNLGPIHP
jgi:hypothetical protein